MDSYHPEMVGALQEAARHGDLRALDTTLSTPADPNQVGEIFVWTKKNRSLFVVDFFVDFVEVFFLSFTLPETNIT